jgi:hypothetical protein
VTERIGPALGRRTFLKGTGALGATTLTGVALSACGKGAGSGNDDSTGTSTSSRTQPTTPQAPPNWSTLAATLTGTLVTPASATYASDAVLYNGIFTPTPAAIAYCANPTDVQRCVAFARHHHIQMAARSGGHSYGGYSSCPGLVIDVTSLSQISPNLTLTEADIGAGAQLIDIYSQLGANGVLLPGGSCPTVGIAGLALGGGIGVFARKYGMTCDNIAGLTMVTADGTLKTCSPQQNEDLYWASRGGGGGNFGVVTSFTFSVHPIPAINLFTLEWPWAAAPTVLDAFLTWIATAPSEAWANCQLSSDGVPGGESVKVTGVFAGTAPACQSALAPLLSAVGSAPTYQFVGPEDYMRATLIEAGCEGKTPGQCNLPTRSPTGTLGHTSYVAKSSFLSRQLTAAQTTSVIDAVTSLAQELPGYGGGVVLDGYGGIINEIAPGDTAFVHRRTMACAQYSVQFGAGAPAPDSLAAARQWLTRTQSTFAPFSNGAYQNYIDPSLPDWATAYYGTNLPRLRTIKRRYDPDDAFRFAQSIPL